MKPPDKTNEELAREIKRGFNVEENFRRLFERRYAQIRRFFRRKGFSPEDGFELTQETFLSVYKGKMHYAVFAQPVFRFDIFFTG